MKLLYIFIFISAVIGAFSNVDLEIFELQHKLNAVSDSDVDFYSFIKVENGPRASFDEINRAYKKISRDLHPDKLTRKIKGTGKDYQREVSQINKRYEMVTLIGAILRSSKKERYDFYLKRGFPQYVNGKYTLPIFKPTLLLTIALLFGFVNFSLYILNYLQAVQDRRRITTLKSSMIDQASRESDGVLIDRKVYNPKMQKWFLVNIGDVFLIDQEYTPEILNRKQRRSKKKEGEEELNLVKIDETDVKLPGWSDIAFVTLVKKFLRKEHHD